MLYSFYFKINSPPSQHKNKKSNESDYRDINQIWKGANPETGEKLEVIHGMPEGSPVPDFPELPEQFAPGIDRDDHEPILKRLKRKM